MPKGLLFGTAGIPLSTKVPATQAGIERVYELGLGCMEVEFVQGVRMSEKSAYSVGAVAQRTGIKLTAHAPYFVNLNAQEREKVVASKQRLLQTARICSLFGGQSIVFHPAFYLNRPQDEVYETVKTNLEQVVTELRTQGNQVRVRPELMGKGTQFGTLNEILRLSVDLEGVAPCIDFAHCHARAGRFNSYHEFINILDQIEAKLGRKGLDDMLIHISGIDYGKGGEKKHLNLKDSDFQYLELLKALNDRNAQGLVVCESPNREQDALLLQQTYSAL
jgi:deoxyribonuclease-4